MVKKYYSYRALPTSKKVREKRGNRQNVTTATQAEVNRRLRMENLTRLIMENYEAGAWYITYTYSEKTTDEKEVVTARVIASRMAMRCKEKKCGNVGTMGNSDIFVCVAHSPGALGTTNAESVHGSASSGFCARENEKKGLTM